MFLKDLIKEEWSGDHLGQCQNKRVNCDFSHDVVFSSCSSDYGSEGIFSENIQGWDRKTPNHKGKYCSMIMAYKDKKRCKKSKSWNVIVIIILKSEIHFCAKRWKWRQLMRIVPSSLCGNLAAKKRHVLIIILHSKIFHIHSFLD